MVGSTFLWGSESYTLTVAERKHVPAVQRSMLRKFARRRRKADEILLQWIWKATKVAVGNAEFAGVRSWVNEHLQNKWKWAGHVARLAGCRPDAPWTLKMVGR